MTVKVAINGISPSGSSPCLRLVDFRRQMAFACMVPNQPIKICRA